LNCGLSKQLAEEKAARSAEKAEHAAALELQRENAVLRQQVEELRQFERRAVQLSQGGAGPPRADRALDGAAALVVKQDVRDGESAARARRRGAAAAPPQISADLP